MKERITSNLHDLYKLGYTCATMVITKRYYKEIWSFSLKIIVVRIKGWNSPLWSWNC